MGWGRARSQNEKNRREWKEMGKDVRSKKTVLVAKSRSLAILGS